MLDATFVHEKRSTTTKAVEIVTSPASDIRVIDPSEYRRAAQCLAEAFADDHIVRYPIDTPDRAHWTDEEKWALHVDAFEYITYAHCLKGMVTTIGPDFDCVALWMPPGQDIDDLLTTIRSGLWRLHYKLSAQGRQRFFSEFLPLLGETKTSALGGRDADSWYLVYIGTKPGSRGRGYCRKLIEHVTTQADAEGKACYLESSHATNLTIYEKMGFQAVKQVHLQEEAGCTMDIMIREPIAKAYGGKTL